MYDNPNNSPSNPYNPIYDDRTVSRLTMTWIAVRTIISFITVSSLEFIPSMVKLNNPNKPYKSYKSPVNDPKNRLYVYLLIIFFDCLF